MYTRFPTASTADDVYLVADDELKDFVSLDRVHRLLTNTYWGKDLRRAQVNYAHEHSFVCAAFRVPADLFAARSGLVSAYLPQAETVGYARAITDRSTYAFICDVIVDPNHRGRNLGKFMVNDFMLENPSLKAVTRWHLMTRDPEYWAKLGGFGPLAKPDKHFELVR